jgi:3-hydroxybutyryl-CoA dehydrogenase
MKKNPSSKTLAAEAPSGGTKSRTQTATARASAEKATAADVHQVAVVGAGTMGAGIAGLLARAGCDVRLVDTDSAALSRGMELHETMHLALRRAKLLTVREARLATARIKPTTSLAEACAGVQVLIEAVTEDLKVKQALFKCFDAFCPPGAVLASNTSGLSITQIGSVTQRADNVAGMHFWNPPHIIPLVEITKGAKTSNATAQVLLDLGRRLGKQPILVHHDVPGCVGNRLQFSVFREALHILQEGIASAEDIDTAMTAGPGLRYGLLGPLRTADLGGLDVFFAISSYLFAELSAADRPSVLLEQLVRDGKLGTKTGSGFFSYGGDEKRKILARRDAVLLAFLKALRNGAP